MNTQATVMTLILGVTLGVALALLAAICKKRFLPTIVDRINVHIAEVWARHTGIGRSVLSLSNILAVARAKREEVSWEVDVPLHVIVSDMLNEGTLTEHLRSNLKDMPYFSEDVKDAARRLYDMLDPKEKISRYSAVGKYAAVHIMQDHKLLDCFSFASAKKEVFLVSGSGVLFSRDLGTLDDSVNYDHVAWILVHLATKTPPEDLPLMAAEHQTGYGPDCARAALALYLLQGGGNFCEACGLKRKQATN